MTRGKFTHNFRVIDRIIPSPTSSFFLMTRVSVYRILTLLLRVSCHEHVSFNRNHVTYHVLYHVTLSCVILTVVAEKPLLVEEAAWSSKKGTSLGSEFSPSMNCCAVIAGSYPAVSVYRSSANILDCGREIEWVIYLTYCELATHTWHSCEYLRRSGRWLR